MSRRIATVLFLLAAAAMLWMPSPGMNASTSQGPVIEAGGACGCPKGLRCCLDCNGHVLCVRSIAQCPECPAP
jgi:hypothetical protein